jgi:UV excision repair protein RAD23
MGFPEQEVRAALRAAYGNAGVAVEYLMSGIPPHVLRQQQNAPAAAPAAPTPGGDGGIEELRRHPQFNMLKRLVQQNPASLGRVLEAIGQQNPELLRAIHGNQQAFLAMMNEPIVDDAPTGAGRAPGGPAGTGSAGGSMRNPAELLQMLMGMPEEMRGQAAQALGMTPEQLQGFTQMLASMPPEQLQQVLGSAPRENVIRLTEEEMAAVTRLTELGFSQQDAAAAYLSCDKNEALAANLLLEGWQAGGDMDMDMGGGNEDDYEGGDDMYS